MHIVQTNKAYYPHIGGIETIVQNLAEGLQCFDGVSVEVLACMGTLSFFRREVDVNNVRVKYVPSLATVASLPISPTYATELKKMRADILHIHEPFPLADLSVLSYPGLAKRFSKIVVSWHSDIIRQKWALSLYLPLLHKFLKRVDKIVVATPNHITSSSILGQYAEKCEVIPYGIKLDWAGKEETTRRIPGGTNNEEYRANVLFVGRLVYYKGLEYLIEAFTSLNDADLTIIGSGPLFDELNQQIARLELQNRVRILHQVSREELQDYYRNCDVFVLPSIASSEAFGIVQVEAMACAKPVVSTNLDTGVTYVNQDGITGITVPPKDAAALARAIRTLIADRDLGMRLGHNGRERVHKEFTQKIMLRRTMDMYSKLLNH